MLELTKNNHFKFGYDDQPFTVRSNDQQRWTATYGPITDYPDVGAFMIGDYRSECANAAKYIYDAADGNVWILYSGGVDSEIVIQAFLDENLPFNVATCRFAGGENTHDLQYVNQFADEHELKIHYFDLDVWEFFQGGEAQSYADMTNCLWPEMTTTMWLMDQVENYPILGSGECYLVKMIPADYKAGYSEYYDTEWYLHEKESIAAWYRLLTVLDKPGCAGFGQYTPEQMCSFLTSREVSILVSNFWHGALTSVNSKTRLYKQWYSIQPRIKYTGFENIEGLIKPLRDKWHEENGVYKQIARTEVRELIRTLNGHDNSL